MLVNKWTHSLWSSQWMGLLQPLFLTQIDLAIKILSRRMIYAQIMQLCAGSWPLGLYFRQWLPSVLALALSMLVTLSKCFFHLQWVQVPYFCAFRFLCMEFWNLSGWACMLTPNLQPLLTWLSSTPQHLPFFFKKYYLFIWFVCVHVCLWMWRCRCQAWGGKGTACRSWFSFYHIGPGIWTQVIRVGCNPLTCWAISQALLYKPMRA